MALAAPAGEGRYGTPAELADGEHIGRSYVCRVVRLTLLAPDIVERIFDGRPTAGLARFLKPFPLEWEKAAAGPPLTICASQRSGAMATSWSDRLLLTTP